MRIVRTLLLFGLTGLLAGCFGLLGGGGSDQTATIVVGNDIEPEADVTIILSQDGDDRATLGTVDAGRERTLRYSRDELQGNYQLIARQASGAAVTSRTFTLFDDAMVRWEIRRNIVSVTHR